MVHIAKNLRWYVSENNPTFGFIICIYTRYYTYCVVSYNQDISSE